MSLSLGINLAITGQNGGGGVVHPAPTQRQLIASFCAEPNLAPTLMAAGGSYTANQIRNGHVIGPANCRDPIIHDIQIRINSGGGAEVSSPAATSIWRRALEQGATTTPATYDAGAISKDMLAGGKIATDIIPVPGNLLAAGSSIFTRATRTVKNAGTGVFDPALDNINGMNMNGPSSQGFRTVGGAQVNGNGAMNASGSGGGNTCWPWMISGIPDVPMAAGRVVGDSIAQYLNDTNTSTTGGYIKRALNNVNGVVMPWMFCALDANKMQNNTPALAPLQWTDIEYLTWLMMQCSTNDVAASRSLVQMQTDFIACSTKTKTTIGPYGLPVLMLASCCLNRGTFTGAMNTVKSDFNTWLLAGAGGYCDGAYDGRPYQGDPAGYSDNIHPTTTDHINMAGPLATFMTPFLDPYYRPPGYVSMV